MNELDQIWFRMLDEATARAERTGRGDVAEYLRLKATNDAIRTAGVRWLTDTFIEIASAQRMRPGITIGHDEPYNFANGTSNMVGSRLEICQGVRCLTVEAGWARTPSDGIMQKGALAFARISHFGMPKLRADLRLVHTDTLPNWIGDGGAVIDSGELGRHFELFLGV